MSTADSGWTPCPATSAPAEPGTPVWSMRLYPASTCGPQSGRTPLDLVVRVARREDCCQGTGCGHVIQPGQLCGAQAAGGRRFCLCCVTTEKPASEFIPRGKAA